MKKLILLIFGIVYYFAIQISIIDLKHTSSSLGLFSFILKTSISQHVNLHIATDKYKLLSLICGKQKIQYNNKSHLWFESNAGEESSTFYIPKGEALCYARVRNKGKPYIPIIKQKYTFFNYVVFFTLVGIPLISFIFSLFIFLLDRIKSKFTINYLSQIRYTKNISTLYTILLFSILLLGVIIRVLYLQKYSVYNFQHDWGGHMEFIKYLSSHWELPLPSKGLQFPQQPLYYIISAGLLQIATLMDIDTIKILGYFSLFCSMVFLYYGYRFFTLMSMHKGVILIATLFIAFTPSLIYISARVNNDVLVMALSALSLYYIIKGYQHHFIQYFYPAFIGTSMLFMTKISAAPIELLLFSLLVVTYLYKKDTLKVKKQLFIFSIVGLFLLGFTLLRVYLPVENSFHFVNSSGGFKNQHIPTLDLTFFTYLDLEQLFNVEYIHSYMKDTSLYTFINHQYRTMLIGEFGYASYINKISEFKLAIWMLFAFGFIYILGFFSYLHYLWKIKGTHRVLFAVLILNLILILKFVFTYPSICNTDFRYFVPSFLILSYIFAQGIVHSMAIHKWLRVLLWLWMLLLTISEIWFLFLLIF